MATPVCRWGILGTATIARKNWKSIFLSGNGRLVAVASRSVERSRQYIADYQKTVPFDPAPIPCGSYEELLARTDIDAVYIPLPTGVRKEWVLRAAAAGKHVLVEKPVGVTSADVEEMIAACRKQNVQLMDGVMFMHSQRLNKLRATLDDGQSVGKIKRIVSHFSFNAPAEFLQNNIRVSNDLEPLGALGDLGWYNIRLTLWALKYQMPHTVTGRMLTAGAGGKVPLEFSAELFFADGVSASFYCSFLTENQQWGNISGDKGFVTIPDFVLPWYGPEAAFNVTNAVFRIDGCEFHMEDHTRRVSVAEYSDGVPNAQEVNLFRTFGDLALSGKTDPHWGEIALKTQRVMDACLKSARQNGAAVTL